MDLFGTGLRAPGRPGEWLLKLEGIHVDCEGNYARSLVVHIRDHRVALRWGLPLHGCLPHDNTAWSFENDSTGLLHASYRVQSCLVASAGRVLEYRAYHHAFVAGQDHFVGRTGGNGTGPCGVARVHSRDDEPSTGFSHRPGLGKEGANNPENF
jgi:hypothetical protein